jgi:hypothetical protein
MAGRALAILAVAGTAALAQEPAPSAVPEAPPATEPAVVSDPLIQRGVPAEASAENAVVARERALAAGQRTAYERMAPLMGLPLTASDQRIEQLVSSIVIEQERVSPTRYAARITVNFNGSRVRAAAAPGGAGRPAPGTPAEPVAGGTLPYRPSIPAAATVEALARYSSISEWAELRQRLASAGPVTAMEVVAISTDRARLRLSLREPPGTAAPALAAAGLSFAPPSPPANGARPASLPPDQARLAQAWRLSLAGRF